MVPLRAILDLPRVSLSLGRSELKVMFMGVSFVSRRTFAFSNVPGIGLVKVDLCGKS